MGKTQDGFTIIEVLMFLAVSGALIGLMIFAVYRMLDNARFSDTITAATSFVQTQYEEARSGVRPAGKGICDVDDDIGRSDCLLLGKAIVFRDLKSGDKNSSAGLVGYVADRIESYFVVSERYDMNASKTDIDELGNSDSALIASEPHLTPIGYREYPLMYSAHYAVSEDENSFPGAGLLYRTKEGTNTIDAVGSGGCGSDNLKCQINVVLILRNPKSAALNTYAFYVDLNDSLIQNNSVENVVASINSKIREGGYTIFKSDSVGGLTARNASMAIPIVNGDSNSRSFGAICIEQGASSASIFGARELSYYSNVNRGLGMVKVIEMLRDKCESM